MTKKVAKKSRALVKAGLPVRNELTVELVPESLPVRGDVDPQQLIAAAISAGNVETLERILALRDRLRAEKAKQAYFDALAAFQSECPEILKERVVYGDETKQKVRYKYANLTMIVRKVKPFLQRHGFSYQTKIEGTEPMITAACVLHHREGHSEETKVTVKLDPKGYMNDTQKVGSAITYATRYAFCAATGIMTADDDDDGRTATPFAPQARDELPQDMSGVLRDSVEFQSLQSQMNHLFEVAAQNGFWLPIPPKRVSGEKQAALKEWGIVTTIEKAREVYAKYKKGFDAKLAEVTAATEKGLEKAFEDGVL